jgi:predicted RNA-binding protein with PIN domain
MPLLYYIDGYNVLHHSTQLRPLLKVDFETARDALVEKVARFCVNANQSARVVFDGRGRRAEHAPHIPKVPGLEVLYSPGHQTADALIERQVYNAPERRHIVVVSGDRSLRDLCTGMGAMVMSPDNFLIAAREAAGHTQTSLTSGPPHAHRPLRIEDRLDEETMRYLRHLKSKLDK